MKIFCKLLGHNWKWVICFEEILCVRCMEVKYENIAKWRIVYPKKVLKRI
jgi:hypothetical protein